MVGLKKTEPWQPRPGMLGHPVNQPQMINEMSIRWTYLELPMMKNFIHKMVEELHRNDHIPHQYIQILSDKFFMKVRGLNFEENGIFIFRMRRNREIPIDFGGLVLHVMTNNNEEIGRFDLT